METEARRHRRRRSVLKLERQRQSVGVQVNCLTRAIIEGPSIRAMLVGQDQTRRLLSLDHPGPLPAVAVNAVGVGAEIQRQSNAAALKVKFTVPNTVRVRHQGKTGEIEGAKRHCPLAVRRAQKIDVDAVQSPAPIGQAAADAGHDTERMIAQAQFRISRSR